MYFPPEKDDNDNFVNKKLTIKDSKPSVVSRVIVSTTLETTEISFGSYNGEVMELKPWVAYQSPAMIGGMLSYTFENSNSIVIPPKKGFRQVRKSKNVSNRYILTFDYMMTEQESNQLSSMFANKLKTQENPEQKNTEGVDEAIESLKG